MIDTYTKRYARKHTYNSYVVVPSLKVSPVLHDGELGYGTQFTVLAVHCRHLVLPVPAAYVPVHRSSACYLLIVFVHSSGHSELVLALFHHKYRVTSRQQRPEAPPLAARHQPCCNVGADRRRRPLCHRRQTPGSPGAAGRACWRGQGCSNCLLMQWYAAACYTTACNSVQRSATVVWPHRWGRADR